MHSRQDYRDNPINWSLRVGRLFGIRIRLHLLFLLWMVVELLRDIEHLAMSAVVVVSLFTIVLLHEFGHCFGARAVGGDADDILLWPLGGLATVQAPMNPRAQFITTVAGPMVNLTFCLVLAPLLLLLGGAAALPLNPFDPLLPISSPTPWHWALRDWLIILWSLNYLLLLFNLLPTFPMDGGRILQSILWKYKGYHSATLTATFIGMSGAVVFGLIGLLKEQLILVGIAAFGYLTCMQQRHLLKARVTEENPWGYDFSRGYQAFEEEEIAPRKPSWWARHRASRLQKAARRERERQLLREREVDRILQKVHEHGLHSLTARERRLLETETQRKKQ